MTGTDFNHRTATKHKQSLVSYLRPSIASNSMGVRRSVRTRPRIHGALTRVRTVSNRNIRVMEIGVLGQDKAGFIATVDSADLRELSIDRTSLRRAVSHSLMPASNAGSARRHLAGLQLTVGSRYGYLHCFASSNRQRWQTSNPTSWAA